MDEYPTLRQPPQSLEAEQAVIGAVLSRNSLLHEIELPEDAFYSRSHRLIWRQMQALSLKNHPFDPVTLCDALQSSGDLEDAGGPEYMTEIIDASRGPANAKAYADIIEQKSLLRRLIRVGSNIAEAGYDAESAQEAIDEAQRSVMELEGRDEGEAVNIKDSIRGAVEDIDRRMKNQGELQGLSTGLTDLDKLTTGMHGGQVWIVAGRPSMGKTTFALNVAEKAGMDDHLVIIFSLEMTHRQLTTKMLSSSGRIPNGSLRSGDMNDHFTGLTAAASKLKDKPIYIDDCFGLTSAQIMSRSRKISQRMGKPVGLIVVDYIQLLGDRGGDSENSRLTDISRNIKKTAVSLDCPVIAVSQLNRSCEHRHNKRPLMSDLRESGAIEQDADVIAMAYRDEVYDQDSPFKGIAEFIIRKQREGPLGTCYAASLLECSKFEDIDRQSVAQALQSYSQPMSKNTKGAKRHEDFD